MFAFQRIGSVPERCREAIKRELRILSQNLFLGGAACGELEQKLDAEASPAHARLAAENLLDQANGRQAPWVEATVEDFNLDARREVFLSNDKLALLLAPARGGQLYELDVRNICLNLLATLSRRPEAYHEKVLAGANQQDGQVASIHDRVVFKQQGLDQRVAYDSHLRNSLMDHFYDEGITLEDIAAGKAMERGDFLTGVYETRIRRSPR